MRHHDSSWIAATAYRRTKDGTVLVITTRDGRALLYGGVPPWLHGLLCAARSVGRAYNLLCKGRYAYQAATAAEVYDAFGIEAPAR